MKGMISGWANANELFTNSKHWGLKGLDRETTQIHDLKEI